jgi:hypothetical protein
MDRAIFGASQRYPLLGVKDANPVPSIAKCGIAWSWAIGMLLSPEALAWQGQLAGMNGTAFLLPFAAAIGLHWLNLGRPALGSRRRVKGEIERLVEAYGRLPAATVLWAARPTVALCLATAVLVAAGFAALMLAVLLAINLAGPACAAGAQTVFCAAALVALASLAGIGLFHNATSLAPVHLRSLRGTSAVLAAAALALTAAVVGRNRIRGLPVEKPASHTP